jgi:sugar phosphate isomerase/epimerase
VRPRFSLAHLTVIRLSPPRVIEVAARTGYETVGLRLIGGTEATPAYALMDDKPAMRAAKAAMSATGVGVLDIEFVRITPEIDVPSLEPFVAAGAELNARYMITSAYDPDLSRFTDRLAAISDLASQYRLRAVLEFFPWTVVPDLSAAMRIVEAAERPGLGILVDTLHFNRSASRLDDLDRISASRLPFVQVADAPVQASYTSKELLHAGRVERLPPGEGGIDIKRILSDMAQDIPVALEVPMTAMAAAEGEEAVALRVRQAAEQLLAV